MGAVPAALDEATASGAGVTKRDVPSGYFSC
jgi:hypothetical protein